MGICSIFCFVLIQIISSPRFLHNKFTDNYTPTIEDFHRKIYKIRGEAYRLDILDTSGNDPFPAMRRLSLLTGQYLTTI